MRMKPLFQVSTAIGLILSGVSMSATALAQEASDAAQHNEGVGLADIIVTAQRREENMQRAAIAISVVDADSLVRAGVTDTAQLTRVAPALQVGTIGGSAAQFYLRGVGNFTTNSLSDAAIALNLDGVPLVRSIAVGGMFFDLERVEVLKGPQGTLYGRNATGGAINVITTKPQLGENSGYATAEYGNFDALKLNAAVNIAAGDKGAFRIAGFLSDRDGYMSDGTGDDKTRAVRVQAASQLTEGFKMTVGGDYAKIGGRGAGSTISGLDKGDRIGLADPRAQAIYASTFAFLAGNTLYPLQNDSFNNNEIWGMYAQADIDTPVGTLTVVPAYRNASVDFLSYVGSFAYRSKLKDEQFSVEARLASDSNNPLSYILGLYYLDEDVREKGSSYNQQYFSAYVNFASQTKSYASFARLTYRLSDSFRLTAGARYTIDDKSADLDSYNAVVVCPGMFAPTPIPCPGTPALPTQTTVPGFLKQANGNAVPVQPWGTSGAILQTTRPLIDAARKFKKFTYRLGFEFDAGPQSLVYGSFETGFKSGGFFSSADNPVYEPETIDAFTLGAKNRFFGNRLQLNVEGFWWTYKDQQVSHFRIDSFGGTEFATENIGKTRIRGIEVEAIAKVASGTTLNASAQYLDARNRDFVYSNPASLGVPTTGCPYSRSGAVYVIDCSGRRPVNAPKWSFSGGLEQTFELSNDNRIVFNANGRYQTSSYTGFEQVPAQRQEGYFMADLQLELQLSQPRISIAGFVNNVTDENVVAFAQPHPRAPALVTQNLRPPRTYGVRVGYKF